MRLSNKGGDNTVLQGEDEDFLRKKQVVSSLYQYSDLSVKNIAQQVDMSHNEVQSIIDEIVKKEAMNSLVEQSITKLDKIMSMDVVAMSLS